MSERDGYILLPRGGYCFGVEAVPKAAKGQVELHGGFATAAAAFAVRHRLANDYDDYESVTVVRIETPEAIRFVQSA